MTHPLYSAPPLPARQEAESEDEEEGAGPIHVARQDWQRERALKNLFAPTSPRADGGDAAPGGGGGSGGGAGGA